MFRLVFSLVLIFSVTSAYCQVPASMRGKNNLKTSSSSIKDIKSQLLQPSSMQRPSTIDAYKPAEDKSVTNNPKPPVIELPDAVNSGAPITKAEEALFDDAPLVKNEDGKPSDAESSENKYPDNDAQIEKKYNDQQSTEDNIIVLDVDSKPWLEENEPDKSTKNLLRIKYKKLSYNLQEADITAIQAMLNVIEDEESTGLLVSSYSSTEDNPMDEKQSSVLRLMQIRNAIEDFDYDISKIKFQVKQSVDNKYNLDYIDIDNI